MIPRVCLNEATDFDLAIKLGKLVHAETVWPDVTDQAHGASP